MSLERIAGHMGKGEMGKNEETEKTDLVGPPNCGPHHPFSLSHDHVVRSSPWGGSLGLSHAATVARRAIIRSVQISLPDARS